MLLADGEAEGQHVGLTATLQFSESRYTIQKEWEGTLECGGGATSGNRDFHVRWFLWLLHQNFLLMFRVTIVQ